MWRKESSEPRRGKYLEPLGFGETQSPLVQGNSRSTRPGGVPKPAGDLGNRTTGKVAGPGRWSSGAKDAEKSAGRLRETGRGRCISYMQRPRPIVPDGPKSHASTRRRGHSNRRRGATGSAAVVRFEGADIAGPLRRHGRAGGKLARLPYRGDERHSRPVRQVHVR